MAYNFCFFLGYFILRSKSRSEKANSQGNINRFAVLIPAHNEEELIGKLIASVSTIDYPEKSIEVIIVADNCKDRTAEIAIESGIKCLIRYDKIKRGKPYALEWALQQIDLDEYDAFVIVDADTTIGSNFFRAMNDKINNGNEAIQGYFDVMNPNDTWLTRIAIVPGILKFRMRYAVKEKLKLSCPLMGNGMCFSSGIIKKYGWNAFSITENWEYYIKLVLNGYRVSYAENATIFSHAVTELSHGETQRKRWLKGQIGVLCAYYKALLRRVVEKQSLASLDALLELLLPSYSMLLSWTMVMFFMLFVSSLIDARFVKLKNWSAVLLLAQVIYCLYAFGLSKPSLKTWVSLAYIPAFLGWKVLVTFKGLMGLKDKTWVKTERRL